MTLIEYVRRNRLNLLGEPCLEDFRLVTGYFFRVEHILWLR